MRFLQEMERTVIIWHNELCSTSRRVLGFLQDKDITISIRDYLAEPPSVAELEEVLRKMNAGPEAILREKEAVYQEQFAGKILNRQEWLEAMSAHPVLIERPVIIMGEKAWLGRPAEEFEQIIRSIAG